MLQENNIIGTALVADENALYRDTVSKCLEQAGFQVAQAGDGSSAIAVAAALNPDVVLLDLALPKVDGLDVLRKLRSILPKTKVVMMSGVRRGADPTIFLKMALKLGADATIRKPFESDSLIATVLDCFSAAT